MFGANRATPSLGHVERWIGIEPRHGRACQPPVSHRCSAHSSGRHPNVYSRTIPWSQFAWHPLSIQHPSRSCCSSRADASVHHPPLHRVDGQLPEPSALLIGLTIGSSRSEIGAVSLPGSVLCKVSVSEFLLVVLLATGAHGRRIAFWSESASSAARTYSAGVAQALGQRVQTADRCRMADSVTSEQRKWERR